MEHVPFSKLLLITNMLLMVSENVGGHLNL